MASPSQADESACVTCKLTQAISFKPGAGRASLQRKGHNIFTSKQRFTYLWFMCMFNGERVKDCAAHCLLALVGCKAAVSLWWLQDKGHTSLWGEFGVVAPLSGKGGNFCGRQVPEAGFKVKRSALKAHIFPCKSVTYFRRHLFVSKQHSSIYLQGWCKWKALLSFWYGLLVCVLLKEKHEGTSTGHLWIIQIAMDSHVAPVLLEVKLYWDFTLCRALLFLLWAFCGQFHLL